MRGHTGRAAIVMIVAVLTASAASAQQPTATADPVADLVDNVLPSPSAPQSSAQVERAFLTLTNRERVSRGLRPLAMKADLVAVARRQSRAMAARGELWHNTDIVNQVTGWIALGENVGRGPTVQDIHDAFMASPDHRPNILDKGFTHVGMGAVVLDDGYIFITEDFEEVRSAAPAHAQSAAGSASASAPARTAPVAGKRADHTHVVDVLLALAALDAPAVHTPRNR